MAKSSCLIIKNNNDVMIHERSFKEFFETVVMFMSHNPVPNSFFVCFLFFCLFVLLLFFPNLFFNTRHAQ